MRDRVPPDKLLLVIYKGPAANHCGACCIPTRTVWCTWYVAADYHVSNTVSSGGVSHSAVPFQAWLIKRRINLATVRSAYSIGILVGNNV